jgi:3-oxoacyl-[acyl-carrier-protein] synthase III
MKAYLCAPRYVLGEVEEDHRELPDLTARAAQLRMPVRAEIWGWGRYRRTELSLAELAIEAGRAALLAGDTAAHEVDMLLLCSTRFPGGAETHGRFVQVIMTELGLTRAAFAGITLNRCTNLLAALDIAAALVTSRRRRRVLVVTADRAGDVDRLENFALFSDGAAGCLVANDPVGRPTYEIVACASAEKAADLDWSSEISADLAREVNDRLLGTARLRLEQIVGLLHANLVLPLVVMKERLAGFTQAQLYTDNIPRIGHCFAADPLINLVDRYGAAGPGPDRHVLLAASVPGSRLGVLLHAHQ